MTENREITIQVVGMTCRSCAHHIDGALREIKGVTDVRVSVRERKAFVKHEGPSPLDELIGALREAGYEGAAET
ncbi:MAG: heavy-metal-associated domain-containing protein [Myxococcales bacterium]|nr:heavy-metal-associated domain-containing protein [Myxococcales bacterium]